MPWTVKDVEKHKKGLSADQKRKWIKIANSVRSECIKGGGSEKDCDAKAIRIANSKVNVSSAMEQISVNFETQIAYQPVTKYWEGKEYLVVPVVMLVEGVHNGSRGPVYHSVPEITASVGKWDGLPVTVSHPQLEGEYVSANSEEVKNDWCVGHINNSHMEENKLKADVWLDVQRLIALSPITLAAVKAGELLEVSVGIFSDEDGIAGNWNGEEYISSVSNYQPDHLALLPEEVGACSTDDGCGLRVNSNKKKGGKENVITLSEIDANIKNHYSLIPIVCAEGLRETLDRVRDSLYSKDTDTEEYYLEEVYSSHAIYRKINYEIVNESEGRRKLVSEQLYKHDYSIENNQVVWSGEPVKVVRKINYINANKEEKRMCEPCKEKASALITNANTHFTEADREWLEALTEDKLDKLIPKVVKVNADKPEISKEQALQTLGIEMKKYEKGLAFYEAKRNEVVKEIMDNTEKGVWEKETLESMEPEVLEKIAKSIKRTEQTGGVYVGAGAGQNGNDHKTIAPLYFPGVELENKK